MYHAQNDSQWFDSLAKSQQRINHKEIYHHRYVPIEYIYIYIALFHLYTINRHVERDFHSDQSTMLLFVDTSRYYTHNIVQVDGYTGTPIVRQILDPFILWGLRNNSRSIPRDWRVDQNNVSCRSGLRRWYIPLIVMYGHAYIGRLYKHRVSTYKLQYVSHCIVVLVLVLRWRARIRRD